MASSDLQDVGSSVGTVCKETSPDSKCPICLDRFNNVSYADSCFHRFCFCCILEWGKNKAECPLCKQPFSAVYHSVCSEVDFRLYKLPPVKNGSFGDVQGRRFRYRTTLTHRRHREGRSHAASRPQEVMRFRYWLYRHDVRVRCVRDDGRSRDTSAAFFRKNPACLHRLVPWLKRELAVLCGSHDSRTDVVLHAVLSLITRYNMQDESFLQKLRPFLSTRTEHFLHEFLSFAKSPFNMEAYDRHAVYDCPAPSRLSAVSEDDADFSSAPSPWDDETPGPSYSSARQHVYTITVSDSDVDSASEEEEEETVSVHANANVNDGYTRVDEDDDSSSDEDCVIIGFIKPNAQRTPELVQLSSDSEVSVKEEPDPSTSNQSELRDPPNQRPQNSGCLFLHSNNKHNSVRNWEKRERSSESYSRRSRSLNHKRRSKVTNHGSRFHTSQHRHSRYTDTQLSHTHSLPRRHFPLQFTTRACSRSRTRMRSGSRTRMRTGSRTRMRTGSRTRMRSGSRTRAHSRSRTRARSQSYGGSWRMQASFPDRKSSERRKTNYDLHCGGQKHKSLHGKIRRRDKEKHHHHHHSKKKKRRRRRSCSMELGAERKKHHKKKKKQKTTKRSKSDQTGQISEATSPAVIIIHSDTQATPPRQATPTNTEERTACLT